MLLRFDGVVLRPGRLALCLAGLRRTHISGLLSRKPFLRDHRLQQLLQHPSDALLDVRIRQRKDLRFDLRGQFLQLRRYLKNACLDRIGQEFSCAPTCRVFGLPNHDAAQRTPEIRVRDQFHGADGPLAVVQHGLQLLVGFLVVCGRAQVSVSQFDQAVGQAVDNLLAHVRGHGQDFIELGNSIPEEGLQIALETGAQVVV
ncbi:hypothetical protein D3C87_1125440 [compost metagenome]